MKSLLYFAVGLFCIATCSAQSLYEAGYFIDNDGNRKECLIKKLSWKSNPTEFEWKRTISSSPKTETIENVKEFAVGEDYRFKRYILQFDLNGDTVGKSTKSKDPNLRYQKIFLRTILKSKTTLYQYSENGVNRFFYTDPNTVYPELLLYKVFYTPDESKKPGKKIIPQQNNTYQQQLQDKVNCDNQDVSKLTYTQRDLKRYFKKYNECKGYEIEYSIRKKINQTRIGIVAAVDVSGFTHNSIIGGAGNVSYDDVFVPRYGIFIETFIPFSKVDLSFFLESTYKAFTMDGRDFAISNSEFELDYKSINVAVGPRFHIYLSSKFELFLEGGLTVDFNVGTESNVFADNEIENTTTDYFYGGGLGSGRFKIGFRQYTAKNISKSTSIPDSELTTSSLYISMNLF
ncbi:hypothetical protein SAMN04487910_2221 [Aquimarina amphilecti]|uniref:Outer membrane protein beta-barrel domain-containing protein n=1 Tax=Aquimarina amphilecti TaxID=1038014 RepID=A0A1H7PI95_AQUAM|nr:hypothetical protein [Aquimarina amphilecti]SEL35492.1 hypothetical protein SAMN04487910_2221 [Aquimarina amphilecti]